MSCELKKLFSLEDQLPKLQNIFFVDDYSDPVPGEERLFSPFDDHSRSIILMNQGNF